MIGLRKYICAQFKPNVAKIFYEMFKAKTVLDFSMGWGDRLAGFYASDCTEHYVGLDPRKENHPIYEQQKEFYEKHLGFFENDKTSEFHISPSEDFDFSKWNEYFDVVFTSPPYFSVERYSYDDTQSWVRYKNIDDWNTNFLHKTLEKIIPTVKKGGIIAINIADVYTNAKWSTDRSWLEICNPMNDYLTSKGLTYEGCIGQAMARRPNSGGAGTAKDTEQYSEERIQESEESKDKLFSEPIWIFSK
jgi:DNA modification methylase